jgi:hypothetical protein
MSGLVKRRKERLMLSAVKLKSVQLNNDSLMTLSRASSFPSSFFNHFLNLSGGAQFTVFSITHMGQCGARVTFFVRHPPAVSIFAFGDQHPKEAIYKAH